MLSACNDNGTHDTDAASEDKGSLKIAMNDWAENIAVSNMWKILLEERGYETELVQVEKAIMYQGVADKELDIGMEIWLPHTDKPYYDEYSDDIDLRDAWYEGTDLALTVPDYMDDINNIEDLEENKDLFDEEIIGIDAGASIMSLTEEVIDTYDLSFELKSSSESAMLAELESHIAEEKPIVVTLWKPHSAFANYDLKLLDDTENIYGEEEKIYYAARVDLKDDEPEVVEWLDNFFLNDEQLGSLMNAVEKADQEEDGAQQWIDNNRDVVDEWFE